MRIVVPEKSKPKRWIMRRGVLLTFLVLGIAGFAYHRYQYPYGSTHRCSKVLAMHLSIYAESHDGKYPHSDQPGALGLSALLDDVPESFDLIVGKAGDLDAARNFYEKHGYIEPRHSSWHYVEGLTIDDNRALAWDKIPLSHHGKRTSSNSREVINSHVMVKVISEACHGEIHSPC